MELGLSVSDGDERYIIRFGLALVWFGSEFRMTLLTLLLTVLPTVYLVVLDALTCFILLRST